MPKNDSLPLVSVIIPTYNRSTLLRLTLESVLAQTYPNIEIIVVDDGSPDDTPEVMVAYAGRINYVRQENQGGSAAANNGYQLASGKYITFLDHDDLITPTKIERQVEILNSRPEIGLCHCGYDYIDEDGKVFQNFCILPDRQVLKELVLGNFVWSGGPLIRRECLEKVGLYDLDLWSSDWDLWLRIALGGCQFYCIQEPLGAYRVLPKSQMSNVPGLEHGVITALDKVFALSNLPAEITLIKADAYSRARFQISCWYYTAGLWDEAQRNLTESLNLQAHLLEDPGHIVQLLIKETFGLRIKDPIRFITNIFDHLPPVAAPLLNYRSQTLAQVHVGLALQLYATAAFADAQYHITEAIRIYPQLLQQGNNFAELLVNETMKLPIPEPLRYVETVFNNLPLEVAQWQKVKARTLSDINIACAFQDYGAGRRSLVARRVLSGIRLRPAWLKNKGVISILLRSLSGLLPERKISEAQ